MLLTVPALSQLDKLLQIGRCSEGDLILECSGSHTSWGKLWLLTDDSLCFHINCGRLNTVKNLLTLLDNQNERNDTLILTSLYKTSPTPTFNPNPKLTSFTPLYHSLWHLDFRGNQWPAAKECSVGLHQ